MSDKFAVQSEMTSSRQLPRISHEREGLPLVPLFKTTPSAFISKSVLPVSQFHLLIEV